MRRRFLICCEGSETEPRYFEELKTRLPRDVVVIPQGAGYNTLSLVKWTEEQAARLIKNRKAPDEVWIVMDRDDHLNFDNAIVSAEAKGFHVAWSNECFELWALLHFREVNAPTPRQTLYKELGSLLQISNYQKDGKGRNLYSLLRKHGGDEAAAAKRANRLWIRAQGDHKTGTPWHQINPVTRVFTLVAKLNAYLVDGEG